MVVVTRYEIRPMAEADIVQVAEIEHESFPTTWPQTAYRRELSNNLARYLVLIDRAHGPINNTGTQRKGIIGRLLKKD
ncbi:MAG TPA: hypothetical protein VFY10_10405, partial [Dehalococcoidia bacterium]|nr:hypothetical protein [Dehalococcoidia bacterium]